MDYNGPTILVDSREQLPYSFTGLVPPSAIKITTLSAGDYSIEGLQDQVAGERKSLIDAYGTFGKGRDRFERELEKLSQYRFSFVVLEADWDTIVFRPPARSSLKPKTVIRSMAAWAIRYGVHFHWCPNRAAAEKWTYILLSRFHNDLKTGKIKI
jgi:DNA excision repair protein ERCC-4